MSRFSGGSSFIRFPATMTSPAVVRSRPAIIRKVVVLPQPDGPRRQTTSPAATERSTSFTATKVPNFLVTFLSSIVDIETPGLSLDRAERHPAQEMVLQEERDEDHRNKEQRLGRGEQVPAHADIAADCLCHGDRHGARLDARQEQREQILVPG